MKILVIDSEKRNLDSALQELKSHEVTICSNADRAFGLLAKNYDLEELKKRREKYIADGAEWSNAHDQAKKESLLPYWDAVFCGLIMPAGNENQDYESLDKYVGKEMVTGWAFALTALENGAKYAVVATDINHHHHPASNLLDNFSKPLSISNAQLLLTNFVELIGIKGSECKCKECSGTGKTSHMQGKQKREDNCYYCKEGVAYSVKGINWNNLLERVMTEL